MSENTAVDTGNAGDVIAFLRRQHQEIRTLLDSVLSSTGEARQRAFDDVRELLARHETAEEMVVRPLTRKAPQGEQVADGRMAEENEAKQVLADREKLDVDSTEFTTTFTQFRQP